MAQIYIFQDLLIMIIINYHNQHTENSVDHVPKVPWSLLLGVLRCICVNDVFVQVVRRTVNACPPALVCGGRCQQAFLIPLAWPPAETHTAHWAQAEREVGGRGYSFPCCLSPMIPLWIIPWPCFWSCITYCLRFGFRASACEAGAEGGGGGGGGAGHWSEVCWQMRLFSPSLCFWGAGRPQRKAYEQQGIGQIDTNTGCWQVCEGRKWHSLNRTFYSHRGSNITLAFFLTLPVGFTGPLFHAYTHALPHTLLKWQKTSDSPLALHGFVDMTIT